MALKNEFEKLHRKIDGIEGQAFSRIAEEYAKGLEGARNVIRKKYDKYAVAGELTYEKMAKYDRIKKLDKELAAVVRKLHVEASSEARKALRKTYKETFRGIQDTVSNISGRTIQGKVKQEVAQKALQNPISGLTLNDRLRHRRQQIIVEIQETIGQGLVDGETYSQMSGRLKGALEDDVAKTERIVRTETHRVQESAKQDSLDHADRQGVKMVKWWLSSQDERVREAGEGDHAGMGEKYSEDEPIPYEEDFVNDETGGEGPTPGQLGTAIDDINCRCRMIVEVVDVE